jgi:uncharacterized oxidoreductase
MSEFGPFASGELRRFCRDLLDACGVSEHDATVVAGEVVDAEERGYDSQGLMRMISYIGWARDGSIRSPAQVEVLNESPAALTLDAQFGWGHVAGLEAMQMCVERARTAGTCIATMRNTPHIGRLGYYVEAAAAEGMIGFIAVSGHPSSATMAPWGGREARLSTNPFAIGFPAPGREPVVIDVSTTQVARGKVLLAAAAGTEIPDGWAFDAEGNVTHDAASALPPKGTLAPLGGHKGYALAIAVELLCGGLSGEYPPKSGAVFLSVINPNALTSEEDYAHAVAEVDRAMTSSAPRPGFTEVLLPGTGSSRRKRHSESEGLKPAASVWNDLIRLAEELGVAIPAEVPVS